MHEKINSHENDEKQVPLAVVRKRAKVAFGALEMYSSNVKTRKDLADINTKATFEAHSSGDKADKQQGNLDSYASNSSLNSIHNPGGGGGSVAAVEADFSDVDAKVSKTSVMSREQLKANLMADARIVRSSSPGVAVKKKVSTAGKQGVVDRIRVQESLQANIVGEVLSPAENYRVNPDDYPIFRKQVQEHPHWGNNTKISWNIDKTMSRYVTATASLIAAEDGTAPYYEKENRLKPDHVIYLDKSARPVSWIVNEFWKDFSDKQRPEHSYLNIDRLPWLRRAGLELDMAGYLEDKDGQSRKPNFHDFVKNADKIPQEIFAKVRALYVEGGIETDDPMEVMKLPTRLDGKNLLIVDEVKDTGVTLDIAKYILKRAIPELASVNGEYFWSPGFKASNGGGERQHLSVPIWYSHKTSLGRGVGDVNEVFYKERYEKYPNPKTRAQAMGALALSEVTDLARESGGLSRELAREIQQMHKDYESGKILMSYPENWSYERMKENVEKQGLRLEPIGDNSPDIFTNVLREIEMREADN